MHIPGGGVGRAGHLLHGGFTSVVNTNYQMKSPDHTILAQTDATDIIITLPLAEEYKGVRVVVKKIDSGVGILQVDGSGTETIDGAFTKNLFTRYSAVELISDGDEWFVLNENNLVTGIYEAVKAVVNTNHTIIQPQQLIFVTTGASNRTITLPDSMQYFGVPIYVKKVDSGAGQVLVSTTELIDGSAADRALTTQWDALSLVSAGGAWYMLNDVAL